ncbi:MAG: MFS transporter, partial [Candidatus Firestonebacteria bacterium]
VFGVAASYILYINKKNLAEKIEPAPQINIAGETREVNRVPQFLLVFLLVTMIVSLNSTVAMYLPAYLKQKGLDITVAGLAFMFYIIPGSLGGIVVGKYFSKQDPKKVIIITQLLTAVFLYAVLFTPAPYFLLFIPFAGACQLSAFPLLVSHSYTLLPKNKGFAAGSIMGLTWGFSSILIFITGLLSDLGGSIGYAYKIVSILPVFAAVLCLKLDI